MKDSQIEAQQKQIKEVVWRLDHCKNQEFKKKLRKHPHRSAVANSTKKSMYIFTSFPNLGFQPKLYKKLQIFESDSL